MLKLYSDAAVSTKDQLAGAGVIVVGDGLHEQLSYPLPQAIDNHLAELHAFLLAIKWVLSNQKANQYIQFYTDSQLVAQSLQKAFIKKSAYKPVFKEILNHLTLLTLYDVTWVPEKENKGADNLAKQALAKQRKSSK